MVLPNEHVGIYIGNDKFIHAKDIASGVVEETFSQRQSGSRPFTKAYRFYSTTSSGNSNSSGSSSSSKPSKDYANATKIKAAGYTFPQYLQASYRSTVITGSSTIASGGCGPTSLAIILAGITNNGAITPVTVVNDLKKYYSGTSWHMQRGKIYNNNFLEKYYNCKSTNCEYDQSKAYAALKAGKCLIGHETNHFMAVVPLPENEKNGKNKF